MELTEKQQNIVRVAKELFISKGYPETSMRDIAKVLGVNASALYNHIASKEDILEFICEDVKFRFSKIKHDVEYFPSSSPNRLKEFIHQYITQLFGDLDAFQIYVKYWDINDEFKKNFRPMQLDFIKFVKNLLAENQIKQTLFYYTEDTIVLIFMGLLNMLPRILIDKKNLDINMLANDFMDKFLHGFQITTKTS